MRLQINEILLRNLEQKFPKHHPLYSPSEKAYEQLRFMTAQDFGYDVEAWKEWFKNSKRSVSNSSETKKD